MKSNKIIQINNIAKSYHLGETQVPALKSIHLDIFAGEYAAIVGASGSGKSTLLNIIGCIDDADSGEYIFDNINVKNLSDDQKSDLRNQKIGFIFQSFNLVPVLNVFENIELPLQINPKISIKDRKELVRESIADVGLEKFILHRPDQLSGGQRQRVAIARALVGHPLLVLADEPTANLDSETSFIILDLMSELNVKKKVTFLFSTHDEKIMSRAGRIIHIKDGVILP